MFWAVYLAGIIGLTTVGLTAQSLLEEVRVLTSYLSDSALKDYARVFEDRYRVESNLGESVQARNSILNESVYARNWTSSGVVATPQSSWVQIQNQSASLSDKSLNVDLKRSPSTSLLLDFGVIRQELRSKAVAQLKATYFKFKRAYGDFENFPLASSARQISLMLDVPAPATSITRCSGVANLANLPLGCEDIYSAAGTPVLYRHSTTSNEIEFFFVAPWTKSDGTLERVSYKIQYEES